LTIWATLLYSQQSVDSVKKVALIWKIGGATGSIDVSQGQLNSIRIAGKKNGKNSFKLSSKQTRLGLNIDHAKLNVGPDATVVHVKSDRGMFSFFLRDVNRNFPIYIPAHNVVVSMVDDNRSFQEIENNVLSRKTQTKIQQLETMPEESFVSAASKNRKMGVPIWLGVSRDMRMFEISEELEDTGLEGKVVRPMYSSSSVQNPQTSQKTYIYALGRGVGVQNNITRKLEQGTLPIYHSSMQDDDINYHSISFVSFARTALTAKNVRGTHYIVADKHSAGRTFKPEHQEELSRRMETAYDFEDVMVLYSRTTIENTGNVPRYAWIKTPRPGNTWWYKKEHTYNKMTGFSAFADSSIFCVSQLNGAALPNEEISVLLQPGERVEYDFFMPHTPISKKDAEVLKTQDFENRFEEAKTYWNQKLASAGTIQVPEKRIQEMLQAGLLHLDLITFGQEPSGTVSANIGVYSPIGTESSPIIQFYLSMGWHDLAKRALNYFLETQLSNGYIQNYEGYTVETGAALWTMGEYFRYTGDKEWIQQSRAKILKSCDYLIQWRNKNKREELRGRGYGLIDGKVADPEDHYHQFMLNGYAYLGLSRIAEALKEIDPMTAASLKHEAEGWKRDILHTVQTVLANSPVVPLGDGRWVSTLPPWAEAEGPRALFQKAENCWSHGTFTGADALLGPLYLVFCEIIATESSEARMLLDYHSELFYQGNAAFSQPYYSRHNWLQAKLGMTKPFLSTYYNTMSAHADRETYTFWEHMYRVSVHKTHEEAWFLMETRWMLYMEEGNKLSIFKTVPREWFREGKTIKLTNVKSYFGNLNVEAVSHVDKGYIEASVAVEGALRPELISIRLPHPKGLHPIRVVGGVYDRDTETLSLVAKDGQQQVRLEY